jgi:hypothetical protein
MTYLFGIYQFTIVFQGGEHLHFCADTGRRVGCAAPTQASPLPEPPNTLAR